MRKKPNPLNFTTDKYPEFQVLYRNESDRVVGILAGTFLERTLEEFLLAHLVDHKAAKELFGRMAPLSSFSAKIKLAFVIGMLPRSIYEDLEAVREVRNLFAHSAESLTFESPLVITEFSRASAVRDGLLQSDGARISLHDYVSILSRRADGSQLKFSNARIGFLCVVHNAVREIEQLRISIKRREVPELYWRIEKMVGNLAEFRNKKAEG